mmetsp:Transcript_7872/g.13156  ORF Transcript_7872/g.13156 Transcript_7872/m.13156 type:complete len:253 (-) Transcript_7872:602-1360(-)
MEDVACIVCHLNDFLAVGAAVEGELVQNGARVIQAANAHVCAAPPVPPGVKHLKVQPLGSLDGHIPIIPNAEGIISKRVALHQTIIDRPEYFILVVACLGKLKGVAPRRFNTQTLRCREPTVHGHILHTAGVLLVKKTKEISGPAISPRVVQIDRHVAVMNILCTVSDIIDAKVASCVDGAIDSTGRDVPGNFRAPSTRRRVHMEGVASAVCHGNFGLALRPHEQRMGAHGACTFIAHGEQTHVVPIPAIAP